MRFTTAKCMVKQGCFLSHDLNPRLWDTLTTPHRGQRLKYEDSHDDVIVLSLPPCRHIIKLPDPPHFSLSSPAFIDWEDRTSLIIRLETVPLSYHSRFQGGSAQCSLYSVIRTHSLQIIGGLQWGYSAHHTMSLLSWNPSFNFSRKHKHLPLGFLG